MAAVKTRFPEQPWVAGGHPRERKKAAAGAPLTLLEFGVGFADPTTCTRGHAGLVLEGELALDLDGESLTIGPGEGFYVAPGTPHRARNPGSVTVRLFVHSFE
jgi:hypothetical protein